MKKSDWYPSKRSDRLSMADNWVEQITKNRNAWNIPQTTVTQLSDAAIAAREASSTPENMRNVVTTAKLKEAFALLTSIMRDIKRRYFFIPPLTIADLVALGLKEHDTTPSNVPPPTAAAAGELYFPMSAIVEMRNIHPLGGTANDISNYGVRIHYGVLGTPDETDMFRLLKPPKTGNDLPHSVFTRKKKCRFDFVRDRGKEVFFCMRYENSKGETGPWGNIISAFIP